MRRQWISYPGLGYDFMVGKYENCITITNARIGKLAGKMGRRIRRQLNACERDGKFWI